MFGNRNKQQKRGKPPTLVEMPDAPPGLYGDPADQFAEIYGSAMVGQARMFVVALLCGVLAIVSLVAMWGLAAKSTVVPMMVPVSDAAGVVGTPTRVENIKPNQAVVKAELGKYVAAVFTIDRALTVKLHKEANVRSKGLAVTQFADFRTQEAIYERLGKDATLQRIPTVGSVDLSQEGLAFVFASTEEAQGTATGLNKAKWRVTLKYEFDPPKTEAEVLENPLGLLVTALNITREGK